MNNQSERLQRIVQNISSSGLSIYDSILPNNTSLWLNTIDLQFILDTKLAGFDVSDLPNRTRSKKVKEQICVHLGFPIPSSFRKTQPRFPALNFEKFLKKGSLHQFPILRPSPAAQIYGRSLVIARRYYSRLTFY